MREADEAKKNAVMAKNDAESFINTVEKQISDLGDKISQADKEDLTTKMTAVREALVTDDTDKIQEAKNALQEASWKVSQAQYGQGAGAEGGEQQSGEEGNKQHAGEEKK